MEIQKIKVLCDHQTAYLPWLGLFHRISLCDIYISLDTVKYDPRSSVSRNKIKTPHGFKWLKVPTIKAKSELLKDIKINKQIKWRDEHLKAISHSYGNAKFFNHYFKKIEDILNLNHEYLIDLNEDLLKFFLDELTIKVKFFKASNFNILGTKNQHLINLCKKFGANAYVFGQMGKYYADRKLWEKNKIKIYLHDYKHPTYNQKFNNFEPYMAIIDLLFNEGSQRAKNIIEKDNISKEGMLSTL